VTGTNGLNPVAQLAERQKCPHAPTKFKYKTKAAAWAAADERTKTARLPIAPYACPGCGLFHLTSNVKGSDVLTRDPGVVTGALRKKSPNHPVFAGRKEMPDDTEPTAGNRDARRRILTGWLIEHDAPTTAEVIAFTGTTGPTAREDMRALGWTISRGNQGRWKPQTPPESREDAFSEPQTPWVLLAPDRVRHIALGDLLDAYAAIGVEVRMEYR
jgi:hypothetical protein